MGCIPNIGTDLVAQLFGAAFHAARKPDSNEFRSGALAALAFRVNGEPILYPHIPGTAQHDAFLFGIEEGHAIYRAHTRAKAARAAQASSPTADGA